MLELKVSGIPRGLGEIGGGYFLLRCVGMLGAFFCLEEVFVHKRTNYSASTEQNLPEFRPVFTARILRLVSWRGGIDFPGHLLDGFAGWQ